MRDIIEIGRRIISQEMEVLNLLDDNLGTAFEEIVSIIMACEGKVVFCGMGKSGHIARKAAATFSSLGTPAIFLHPAEAVHGDLGMVSDKDVVVLLSYSGETEEIIKLLPSLKQMRATLVGVTANGKSTLARECQKTEILDIKEEAGTLGLAPTSSTTAMLVYCDALALTVAELNGFTSTDFGKRHPAGTLGKKVLLRVKDIMATKEALPSVGQGVRIADAIMEMSKKGLGVVGIVDCDNKLAGLLTDGDLRRAIENKTDFYRGRIDAIMTDNPGSITEDILLVEALERLKESHFNNYPVVDEDNHLIGMITWQMIIREGIVL